MSKSSKAILFLVGGTVGFFVLAFIILMVLFDANSFKARLETTASNRLQMEVVISGAMRVKLLGGPYIELDDVHLRNHGVDVASVAKLKLGIELWPLLRRDLRFKDIVLTEPIITIANNTLGKLNFERTKSLPSRLPSLNLPHVSFVDATLVYVDRQTDQDFHALDCYIDVYELQMMDAGLNASSNNIYNQPYNNINNNLTFSAKLECGQVRADGYQIFDLQVAANKDTSNFNLKPIFFETFGARGTASIFVNFADNVPQYKIQLSLPQFSIEPFFKTLASGHTNEQLAFGNGTMDFSTRLSMHGKTMKEITRSANGKFSITGKNLTLDGTDLDHQFEEFESSQHFNLFDVGAFFYAGPLGLILTKGHDFSGILRASGGHSEIALLVSNWQVKSGVAIAEDVAMATKENRIALGGELDFINGRYDDIIVALIDADGCVVVQQEIHGDFVEPVVEQPNILKSLAGPVISLLEKGRVLFPGGECDVFYIGSVPHPK